ncbi:unnamed protein product, partial [Laminaria digitata]
MIYLVYIADVARHASHGAGVSRSPAGALALYINTRFPFGMIAVDLNSRGCRKLKRENTAGVRAFLAPATRSHRARTKNIKSSSKLKKKIIRGFMGRWFGPGRSEN